MILSPEQQSAVAAGEPVALTVAGTECVLVRKDVFLQLAPEFDAGPWTPLEMDMLADEVDEMLTQGERHGS